MDKDTESTKELLVKGIKNLIKPDDIIDISENITTDFATLNVKSKSKQNPQFEVSLVKSGGVWELDDIAGYVAQVGMFMGDSPITEVGSMRDQKLAKFSPKEIFMKLVEDLQKVKNYDEFTKLIDKYGSDRMKIRMKGLESMLQSMGPLIENMTAAFMGE